MLETPAGRKIDICVIESITATIAPDNCNLDKVVVSVEATRAARRIALNKCIDIKITDLLLPLEKIH